MAGRDRGPQNIRPGSSSAVGELSNEPPHVLRQQPNRADDPLQRTQFSGVVTARTSLDDETVHEAAIEPDTHPHACLGVLVHLRRNLVVEETVEVWHPNQ